MENLVDVFLIAVVFMYFEIDRMIKDIGLFLLSKEIVPAFSAALLGGIFGFGTGYETKEYYKKRIIKKWANSAAKEGTNDFIFPSWVLSYLVVIGIFAIFYFYGGEVSRPRIDFETHFLNLAFSVYSLKLGLWAYNLWKIKKASVRDVT